MQYRNDKYGNKISILGYGCMRFTNKNGKKKGTGIGICNVRKTLILKAFSAF